MRGHREEAVDDACEACGRSVVARFPNDPAPAFCESCDDDFRRELSAGHVSYADGEPVYPVTL